MRILSALAKLVFAGFVAALLIGLAAGFGKQAGLWDFRMALGILPWAVYVGAAAFGLGVIWVVWALVSNDGKGALWGIIGTAGAACVIALPLYEFYVARSVPPIHDITTDIANPPQFVAILPLRAAAHALNPPQYDGSTMIPFDGQKETVAQLQRKYYPDIFTVQVLTPPAKLFARALKAAEGMGWHIVAQDPKTGRIEASDTTFFMGFTDDVVIRVEPSGSGAKLDIRSESRVGFSDIGTNARRIRAYFKELANTSG